MGGGAWSPLSLFAAGEQGAWYDPSDLSTLYQDAAGTTPVTGVEQRVGLMLDQSGRDNHAFQATTTPNDKRPVLSARVNLLTKTEQFDNTNWAKTNASVTANAVVAPDGTLTADKIVDNAVSSYHLVSQQYNGIFVSSAGISFSVYAKAAQRSWLLLDAFIGTSAICYFDLVNGVVGTMAGNCTGTITSVGNGWYRCNVTRTVTRGSYTVKHLIAPALSDNTGIYLGDGTSGIYIWGADLRQANNGNNIPAYQRVNTATDYDTAGFPYYLKADGTYTSMSTNSIDFSGTDKMTVVSGVRKLSDAAQAAIVELSNDPINLNGIFILNGAQSINEYFWQSKGSFASPVTIDSILYQAPISNIITGSANISTDTCGLRINGTSVGSSSSDQGTGNYGNYPLYLFARNNASLFLNGYFYGAIIQGTTTSGTDLTNAESYMNDKSGGLY